MSYDPVRKPPATRVHVFNAATWQLATYDAMAEAIEQTPGIGVVEKDAFFFASDGSPLEARVSTPARFHSNGTAYTNGVYTLAPGTGRTLQDWLFS